tara:strand:- start:32 stop:973 length:942 start_codon:yes stop_codon:yes gene_type:complete
MSIDISKIINKDYLKNFTNNNNVVNFLDQNYYSDSFGFQWNIFEKDQLDSINKTDLSYRRFKYTKWDLNELENKFVLEVGSGAGRFTEIIAKGNCKLVTLDSSSAIYTNFKNNNHKNIIFLKCNIEKDIFLDNSFDFVFCYGVIQHTEKPFDTLNFLIKKLKPGGKLSADFYRKMYFPTFYSTPKYIWRFITKKMKRDKLLRFIEFYIPKYLPIDTLIKRIFGKLSIVICGIIPIPCYQDWTKEYLKIDKKIRTRLAILDTFDALSPTYDQPLSKNEINNYLKKFKNIEYNLEYGSNGIVLNLKKIHDSNGGP